MAMLAAGLAYAAQPQPLAMLGSSTSVRIPDSIVAQQIDEKIEAARIAASQSRFEDCIIEASVAQELAQAYVGFMSAPSQKAMGVASECINRVGNKEQLSQGLKQRLASETAKAGELHPRSMQSLRALALVPILNGDKAEGLQWQTLYVERLANSVGQHDPRYPAALNFFAIAYSQAGRRDDRPAAAAASLERADRALRLAKAIFGTRHAIYAEALVWHAGRYEDWVNALEFDAPTKKKSLRRKAHRLTRQAFEASRRVRGDLATETMALASTLAERGDSKERTRMLQFVATNTALGEGKDHPATLMAEFDLATASNAKGSSREALKAIAARAIALDDPGSQYGQYMFTALVMNFELLDMGTDAAPEWLHEVDSLMTTAQRLSVKVDGHASIAMFQRQLRYRLRHEALNGSIGEIAQRLYNGASDKQRNEGELSAAGQRERDEELAPAYRLVARATRTKDKGVIDSADADLAFSALQNSLSGSASAALARAAARKAAGSVSQSLRDLVDQREKLRDDIQEMDRQFSANAQSQTADATGLDASRFMAARRELEAVNGRLGKEFPNYFSFIQPEPIPIAGTMQLLSTDEAILMLVPDGQQTHIFAVNDKDYKWILATHTKPGLERQVQRLLWDLGAGITVDAETEGLWVAEDGERFPYHRDIAWQLYRELIEPVSDILRNRRHLFLVQGGVLSGLPLSVLVTKEPTGDDADPDALRNTSWLIDQHTLSILPSIQSLALLRDSQPDRDRSTANQRFIGFGDPSLTGVAQKRGAGRSAALSARDVFRLNGTRSAGSEIDIARLRSLNRLPGTARELADIARLFGSSASTVFLADEATESRAKLTPLDGASVIAFATHGLLAGEIRGTTEPGLILTPPAQPTDTDNGFLSSSEIASLRMDADWVILSACNTAGGDGLEGAPGLSGLARSFLYAGARSLLVSHWPVRDDVASRLTVDSIRRQRQGLLPNAAEALRASIQAVRNDKSQDNTSESFAHPNAWAPFSLVGDLAVIGERH